MRDGNIGGILSRTTAVGAAFYGYDGNGNVTLLTNSTGQDVGHYRYDAFGNTLEAVGARAGENPYRFSTKELHGPSGLYDYGFRFYSPGMGRWLNRDPLGEGGGVNLYGMVGNNPVNDVDAYGLVRWKDVTDAVDKWVKDVLEPPKATPIDGEDPAEAAIRDKQARDKLVVKTGSKAVVGNLKANRPASPSRSRKQTSSPAYAHPYTYHPRIRQRSVEDPGHHNFPYSFDSLILMTRPIRQSDGSVLYRRAGYFNKKPGVFEIAVNPKTRVIFHRTFNASKNLKTK